MEFVPMEKYSLNRRTAKHKKDVEKVKKKVAVKVAKAARKGKEITTVPAAKKVTRASKSKKPVLKSEDEDEDEEEDEDNEDAEEEMEVCEDSESPVQNKYVPTNRLFVNMKKKILNVDEVKDLHPDIVSVTFPRKKPSSWCWAVFDSKETAIKALKVLKKRDDIIVNHMLSDEVKKEKKEKKMKKVKAKKAMKNALKEAWS